MKICFKCSEIRSLDDFYKHPRMADGHLNKCKDCAKKDTMERHNKKRFDPFWVISELKRHRDKSAKYREMGIAPKPLAKYKMRWLSKNQHKRKAHYAVSNAIRDGKLFRQSCQVCENPKTDAHHEDYSKPLDVMWLCKKHHGEHHHNKTVQSILKQLHA